MIKKFNPADNLTKKGAEANPNGRPKKGYSITEAVQSMLTEKPEVKKAIVNTIAKKALEGDSAAIRMIWQYMDGMPRQDITSGGKPIPASILGTIKPDDIQHNDSDEKDMQPEQEA